MNVFFLSQDPNYAAIYQCDSHVVKMTLETAQLLSTCWRTLEEQGKEVLTSVQTMTLYKKTHENHPCSKWLRLSSLHYEWTYLHFKSLLNEYSFRYGRNHRCNMLLPLFETPPTGLPSREWKPPPMAMPEGFHSPDVVLSYRNYYKWKVLNNPDKFRWRKGRPPPSWLPS